MIWQRSLCLLLGAALLALAAPASSQMLVLDLDPDPGDQGQREAAVNPQTQRALVQLHLAQAPPFANWTAQLSFDPALARFVEGSLKPGSLFPDQQLQSALPADGMLVLSGAQPEAHLVSGEGELAQFELVFQPGVIGAVRIWVSALRLEGPEWSTEVPVEAEALLVAAPPAEAGPELLGLAGAEARSHLLSQRACAGCDLRRQDLAQLDLQEVDLRQAQLQETTLVKADLRGADLRGVQLNGASLLQADLRGVRLQSAQLKDARLGGAKLQGADFTGANLDTLDLQGVNLAGALWIDGRICGSGSFGRCR